MVNLGEIFPSRRKMITVYSRHRDEGFGLFQVRLTVCMGNWFLFYVSPDHFKSLLLNEAFVKVKEGYRPVFFSSLCITFENVEEEELLEGFHLGFLGYGLSVVRLV